MLQNKAPLDGPEMYAVRSTEFSELKLSLMDIHEIARTTSKHAIGKTLQDSILIIIASQPAIDSKRYQDATASQLYNHCLEIHQIELALPRIRCIRISVLGAER